jgi:crotonobetainyl-CoA:carnitine CoA-transferase CaiB-like acyl-CoA transferase
MLCDLGAEVIKIEPPEGDLSRRLGARRGGISGYFMQQNCGKLNVSLDLQVERGRELAAAIVAQSDVLVENFRPGVMERLGLGAAAMTERNPRLVYCSISGFGQTGPWRDRRAFAGIAHATSGMLLRQARATNSEPADSVLAIGDSVSGLQATVAILAALRMRERTGRGQTIDLAMHDALLSIQEAANFHLFSDESTHEDFLCSWIYRCGGEHVAIPHDPRAHWDRLTRAIERPELLADPRYDTYEKRAGRLDELEALIQAWVADQPSADAVVDRLAAHGLPGARLMSLAEALDCEQSQVRNLTPRADDRSGNAVRVINSPYRFSAATAGLRGVPAFRGEDNRSLLTQLLGLSEEEIVALERDGVLSSRMPERH